MNIFAIIVICLILLKFCIQFIYLFKRTIKEYSWFSVDNAINFLTGFSLVFYACINSVHIISAFLWSSLAGLAVTMIITLFVFALRKLYIHKIKLSELIGKFGRVHIPVSKNEIGSISIIHDGELQILDAILENDETDLSIGAYIQVSSVDETENIVKIKQA